VVINITDTNEEIGPNELEELLSKYNITEKEINTILKQKEKHNLNVDEISQIFKQIPQQNHNNEIYNHRFSGKHSKFGIISDTHIGNNNFKEDLFMKAVYTFNKESVDIIYHPGDICEGMSNREGHIYELAIPGITNQVKHATELLNQFNAPVYGITGNHELWATNKANQGLDVGDYLDNKCDNYTNLGQMEADIDIGSGVILKLYHGMDGSAYAPGYRGMKLIESLQGGQKPNILLSGHTHKYVQMFQRNIHYTECGCLEDQTAFMRGKKLLAHTGFLIIDVWYNKNGLDRIQTQFYPSYD